MTPQIYLKRLREQLNLSVTAVSLQTSLSKELITTCENQAEELDLAAFFILQDHYAQWQGGEESPELPSYAEWLAQLQLADEVLVKERTIGIADSFKYRLDSIRELAFKKIILTTGLEIERDSGALNYQAPTGTVFSYKIYPKSSQIRRIKKLSFLEQAVCCIQMMNGYS